MIVGFGAGCSSLHPAPSSSQSPSPGVGAPAAAGAAQGLRPWQIEASSYGTQILYHVTVTGAEGEGSLKLTLRLATADHYQVQAVDPLGRALWGLEVEGDGGLWVDYRAHTHCRLTGALDLSFLPLGPLSLSALPPLLLGRLPVPPAEGAIDAGEAGAAGKSAGAPGSGEVSYRDAGGRRWSALLHDGRLISWGLWPPGGKEPILSWVRSGAWSVLSDRRKGVQVRWRQAVQEPLTRLVPLQPAAASRETSCENLASQPAEPPSPGQ